jgi:hypothetical protein
LLKSETAAIEVEMLTFINAILGAALLLAGRKLFWLFVAAAGFITGFQVASQYFQGVEAWAVIVGLVVGAIFAILAIFLQTIAIGIAGFLAGGFVLQTIAGSLGLNIAPWLIYLIGGIIGVILISFLFDWAIITLSSLAGASLVVAAFQLPRAGLIFLILFLAGVIIQGTIYRYEERRGRLEE